MTESGSNPRVILETSMGTIEAELWADRAPKTVENFLQYVDEGHYADLTFHRVIPDFMVQGGGMTADMQQRKTHDPIPNEATADKRNLRGTLAMARTSNVHSATSQFFINLVDNGFLDHRGESPSEFGYCAFGEVVSGMDVVDRIAAVATTSRSGHQDVPADPIVIQEARRAE